MSGVGLHTHDFRREKLALITLSEEGAAIVAKLYAQFPHADCFVQDKVEKLPDGLAAARFASTPELTAQLFGTYRGLVFVAPCGVVVRAIASCVEHKLKDPAVVVLDVLGRHAVSLLSGHEGGANELAIEVANILGAEPVITTTSEAKKRYIAGIGCRRGAQASDIHAALEEALRQAGLKKDDLRLLASVDLKADEPGLREVSAQTGIPLRIISSQEILSSTKHFDISETALARVGLPAVAEPAALLAGRRTLLILKRIVVNSVTVAIAKENSPS